MSANSTSNQFTSPTFNETKLEHKQISSQDSSNNNISFTVHPRTQVSEEGSSRALKKLGVSCLLGFFLAISVACVALGIIFQVTRHTSTSVFPSGFSSTVAYVFSFILLVNGITGMLSTAALYSDL